MARAIGAAEDARASAREGTRLDYLHRLHALDREVEQLRMALEHLQRHLEAQGPRVPTAAPQGKARDDHLRAYA